MLAPDFIKERFGQGTRATAWFRNNARGGMPGEVCGWDEHKEELSSYVLFRTIDGDTLYLPFADIYLSVMTEANYNEAKADFELAARVKGVNRRELSEQVKTAERGGGRIQAVPGMGGPGGPRFA